MKYEIYNGEFVGTAEWEAPGRVALDMDDEELRDWFRAYFSREDTYLAGPVEAASMTEAQRRDSSEAAFEHATFALAGHAYSVKRGDGARAGSHR